MFGEAEPVSEDVQFELTERARREAHDAVLVEWGKAHARIVGAVDHFSSVVRPSDKLRDSLRVVIRSVERVGRDLER
jgi:hypothetical protein